MHDHDNQGEITNTMRCNPILCIIVHKTYIWIGVTPNDLLRLFNHYIQECCVYDHTFAFPTLLQHISLFQNFDLCFGLYFPLMKTNILMMGSRFVYIHCWYAQHCYGGANGYAILEVTFWSNTIPYEGGKIKPEHVQSTGKLTMPAMGLCRYIRFISCYVLCEKKGEQR